MGIFSASELAILAKSTVRVALLVELQFSPVLRLWNGARNLTAGGYEWSGLGGLGKIDGLQESRSAESSQVRFTLSGTNAEINALAVADSEDQTGKLALVYFQFFADDWQTVGSPKLIWAGLTQPMTATRISGEEGEGAQRSIMLPAENLFYGRARPRAGLYTDRDQQARHSGDKFFEFQPQLRNLTYVWP